MKKTIQYLFSLGFAFLLLWWVFKDIDLDNVWQKIQQANFMIIAASGVLALLAHWVRAARWALMLRTLGYRVNIYDTTLAVLVGYGANLIFPRAGEVARCGTLNKLEDVPFEKSFGSVIAERLVDVLALLFLIFLNVVLEFGRLKGFFIDYFEQKFQHSSSFLWLFPLLLIVGLGIGFLFFRKYQSTIQKASIFQKLKNLATGLAGGFWSIKNLKNPRLFVIYTILLWLLYFITTYVLCFALPETSGLSTLAALTIFTMGSIGMAAPTQGGIGTYHLLVGSIVVLYGLSQQDGITLATFLHAIQGLFFVALFGIIAFVLTFFTKRKKSDD